LLDVGEASNPYLATSWIPEIREQWSSQQSSVLIYIYNGEWSLYSLCITMVQHQGTLGWDPNIGSHPNVPWCCVIVVHYECFDHFLYRKMLDLQHQYNNCTTIPHMRVGLTYWGPPSCGELLCSCCICIVPKSNPYI
jgi:hypothetical protein